MEHSKAFCRNKPQEILFKIYFLLTEIFRILEEIISRSEVNMKSYQPKLMFPWSEDKISLKNLKGS